MDFPRVSPFATRQYSCTVVWHFLSQSELRLPFLQMVSNNKSFSVGVQSPTEINAPRGCAVILRRICQLSLTRITHQVSRAFGLNIRKYCYPDFFHRFTDVLFIVTNFFSFAKVKSASLSLKQQSFVTVHSSHIFRE